MSLEEAVNCRGHGLRVARQILGRRTAVELRSRGNDKPPCPGQQPKHPPKQLGEPTVVVSAGTPGCLARMLFNIGMGSFLSLRISGQGSSSSASLLFASAL